MAARTPERSSAFSMACCGSGSFACSKDATALNYTRSPATTGSAAISPVFDCSTITDEAGELNYPFYWASTTHAGWINPGENGVYVCFGEALGYFGPPGMESWIDVHGAGAQRSDPKTGDPADWPTGHGPQGDAIRIYNFVRPVRDAVVTTSAADFDAETANALTLSASPNPASSATTLRYEIPSGSAVTLEVFDVAGRRVRTLMDFESAIGGNAIRWDGKSERGDDLPAGIYLARLSDGRRSATAKLVFLR